jgi:hypothetical protein
MSHYGNPDIAHSEAALGAGRPYEKKSREGHDQMFDDVKDLAKHNAEQYGHNPDRQSRGKRIDQELEKEDKDIIDRQNQAREQKEESHRSKHHNDI